jgi:hypothetical protein
MKTYYRGGASLVPRAIDVIINPTTGMVAPARGVSVYDRPDGMERFGGAYEVGPIPDTLRIIQKGRDLHHHEIVPAYAMPFEVYQAELAKIPLTPV